MAKKEAKAALGSLISATALQPVKKSTISVDPVVKSQFFRVSPSKEAKGQWADIADELLPHTRYLGSDNNDLSDPSVFRRLRKLLNDVGPATMVYLDLPAFVDEGTDDSSILNSAQQRTLERDRWTLYCQRLSILVKGVRKKGGHISLAGPRRSRAWRRSELQEIMKGQRFGKFSFLLTAVGCEAPMYMTYWTIATTEVIFHGDLQEAFISDPLRACTVSVEDRQDFYQNDQPVSYTHLTLPTKRIV